MEMKELLGAVTNYGFPIILSWYLLLRMERKLDTLSNNIQELANSIKLQGKLS